MQHWGCSIWHSTFLQVQQQEKATDKKKKEAKAKEETVKQEENNVSSVQHLTK